jgi:hypothetical protein
MKIESAEQRADIITKGLQVIKFVVNCGFSYADGNSSLMLLCSRGSVKDRVQIVKTELPGSICGVKWNSSLQHRGRIPEQINSPG